MLRATIFVLAISQAVIAQRLTCTTTSTTATNTWCTDNCNLGNCPDFCDCNLVSSTNAGCEVVVSGDRGLLLPWCLDNCYHNPSFCPTNICDCSATIPFSNPLIAAYFLSPTQEVPPNQSADTGSCFSWFINNRKNLIVRCVHTVSDLTAAHVHNNVFGVNGPILHPFTPAFPNLNQNTPIPSTTVQKWINGQLYTNVHNAANPGGRIRGQIARVANIGATYYNFFLTAGEASSTGLVGLAGSSGSCAAAVRPTPGAATFDFIVACLHNVAPTSVTRAVVGGGLVGSAGVELFTFTTGAAPFLEGRFTLTAAQNTNLVTGKWFIRIDTAAGSIRGQVVDSARFPYPVVN